MPLRGPILLDVDGVVWLSQRPLPGAVDAIRRISGAGVPYAFVTNNSYRSVTEQERALEDTGVSAKGKVLTSSLAAAYEVVEGSRVLVGGGPGIIDAVRSRGVAQVSLVEDLPGGHFDHVVVGFHRHFNFDGLHLMSRAIRSGASFIATNDDSTYPTPEGPIPGGGSIVAAVAVASGVEPTTAGKPHEPMARLVRRHFGTGDLGEAWMIGDRWSTDGRFAQRLGCRFARVVSSVSEDLRGVTIDLEGESLAAVVDQILRDIR